MIDNLDDSFRWPSPFDTIPWGPETPTISPSISLRPNKIRDLEALQRLRQWKVVMRAVVVHSDVKTAVEAGLFGLLGDARIQIVDVSEETRIEAFLELAETCERKSAVVPSQRFHRESVESMEKKLRDVVIEQFQSEELVTAMRPAIMFRLCTRMCNHVGNEHKSKRHWESSEQIYAMMLTENGVREFADRRDWFNPLATPYAPRATRPHTVAAPVSVGGLIRGRPTSP